MALNKEKIEGYIEKVPIYICLSAGALVMIIPFVWMVTTSLKSQSEILAYPPTLMVYDPTLQWYKELFHLLPMWRYYFNSLFVAGAITIANLFVDSLAGYTFAKHNFWGKEKIFVLLLATVMIPWQVNLIPGFVIVKELGWLNSFKGLIIPSMASAFGIFLIRQFIKGIPNDLLEAARIDGCSEWGIYWRIILPNCKPVLAALGIFIFMGQWNNFIWPLVIIHASEMRTIPLAMAVLNGQFSSQFGVVMAGAVCAVIPVLIVFFLLQKWIIKGITLTGMKV